ncbi:hypothetical protein KBX37_06105 [Micromonospora sp. U56]|uniref:hypothetical protein n=1 Tax=Micromonospora sp. U56 TaxID=2824900 RepID=UPI001B3926AF|nr:hypothetical protein [Micromonospora sp. U56]MBQ0892680.1 hypothetical protein [Micromonospora sp. U56]
MSSLLGGPWPPVGWSAGWIEAPKDEVETALADWREADQSNPSDLTVEPLTDCWPECLQQLLPLEAPWTTELLVEHGGRWTCYLNNDLNGGDAFPVVGRFAAHMSWRGVISVHQPRTPVGHASTQLQLFGPQGEPPLMYVRTIAAQAEDGRRSWHESGRPQWFEHVERYSRRLKRDRLDRQLLVEYLLALGIDVDNDAAYGASTLIRQRVTWSTRKQTLPEARKEWGLSRR